MKTECLLEKLKSVLPVIDKITGKNLTLNILSSILIISNGKTLKFRATNLDIGIEVELPSKIEKEGVVAVNGSVLSELISNIQNEKSVIFESSGDNLLVITKNNTATVKCYPYSDFPTIPLLSGENSFNIEADKFLSGIKSVSYSASYTDIKPQIASIYIYPNEDELVFVSTDSFRLAEKKIKKIKTPDFNGILIPYKNINEIIRVLELTKETINVCFNKNQISFSYDGVYLTSRLIDGSFPDYKQIIPKEHKTEAIVLKQDLINALKINNIFIDKLNQINLKINPKTKTFSINTKSGETGETNTDIAAVMKGDEIRIHLNYKYVFDVFQSITSDSVSLLLSDANKPVVVCGVSDNTFTYLVMPLNK